MDMTDIVALTNTDYEKRRESRLDKFLDYLNPDIERKLGKKEQIYFNLMQKSFNWRTMFFSPEQVRRMLMQEPKDENGGTYSYSMACQLYADMEYIFGKDMKSDKNLMNRIISEHLYKALQLAYQDKKASDIEKAEVILKITDKIAKVNKVYDNDGFLSPEMVMPQMLNILIKSTATTNNNVILPPKAPSENE
jgi:hypothetical protein